MKIIEQIGNQFEIYTETECVLLMCNETHYFAPPHTIPKGITWSGRPVELFDTIQEAERHIIANDLIEYVEIDFVL